jgi:hypothetical protein
MRLLAMLLLVVSWGQDASIADLLRRLEDDQAELREAAQRSLVTLGDRALPALHEVIDSPDASAELKLRASAVIRQIEQAAKEAKVFTEPRRITLAARDQALGDILREISRQTGVSIDASAVDGTARTSLDAREMPLFQALDLLCRDQADRSWEAADDGSIRMTRDRHLPSPAVYGGPFRVRIPSLSTQRTNDWKARTVSLTLTLQGDWDRRLKPSRMVDFEITRARDDQGSPLEVSAFDAAPMWRGGPGVALRVGVGLVQDGGESSRAFTLRGLSPAATTVELEGVARFTFPLDQREIKFENPGATETRDLGDTTVRLSRTGSPEIWTLSFHKSVTSSGPGWARGISQRFDPESFVVIDQDGGECPTTMRPQGRGRMLQQAAEEIGLWYQAFAQRMAGKVIKEARFRFVDQTLVKTVPFQFTALAIP